MNAKEYIQAWKSNSIIKEFFREKSLIENQTYFSVGERRFHRTKKERWLGLTFFISSLIATSYASWNFSHNAGIPLGVLCVLVYGWLGVLKYKKKIKFNEYDNQTSKIYSQFKSKFFTKETLAPLISFLFTNLKPSELENLNKFVTSFNNNNLTQSDIDSFLAMNDKVVEKLTKSPPTESIKKFLEENSPKNSRVKYLEML